MELIWDPPTHIRISGLESVHCYPGLFSAPRVSTQHREAPLHSLPLLWSIRGQLFRMSFFEHGETPIGSVDLLKSRQQKTQSGLYFAAAMVFIRYGGCTFTQLSRMPYLKLVYTTCYFIYRKIMHSHNTFTGSP